MNNNRYYVNIINVKADESVETKMAANIPEEAIESIADTVEQYSKKKTTVGVNIELPKEDYRRLQNMRINLDGIPLRSLALQLVQQGIDKYEKGL